MATAQIDVVYGLTKLDTQQKKFARKSFPNKFKFKDWEHLGQLQHADFRCASLVECDFSDCDLRHANFESANCYGANFYNSICNKTNFKDAILEKSNFTPKDCYGMTITLDCATYDGMTVDALLLKLWEYIPTRFNIPDVAKDKIIALIGAETYQRFKMVFDRRII